MGQTTAPLGMNTQQLNETATAMSSPTGTATFTFLAPAAGEVWSGTLAAPSAPTSAAFVATVGTVQWAQWAGAATAGPVQMFVQQALQVTATGLLPLTEYQVNLIGTRDTDGLPAPLWPDPTTSSAVTLVGPIPVFSNVAENLVSGVPIIIDVPPAVRTLILQITNDNNTDTTTNVEVNAGPNYYNAPPYLVSVGLLTNNGCTVIVPLPVTVAIATVTVTTSAGNYALTVSGDNTLYDESVFYNGVPSGETTASSATLINGPCRLLTGQVSAGTGGVGSLVVDGVIIASATGVGATALTFPQPYIVPTGQSVTATIGAPARVSITTAYP